MPDEVTTGTSGSHFLTAVDGFILTGALWLLLNVTPAAVMLPLGVEEPSGMGGVLDTGMWFVTTIAPLFVGAVAAWVLHGKRLSGLALGGMVAGVAVGFFAGFALLGALAGLVRMAYVAFDAEPVSGPPWVLVGVIAVVLIGILVWPLVDAVRDLGRSRRTHTRLDVVRLTALAIIVLLAVVVAPWLGYVYGSEIAEAGAFLGPIAFAGAVGVVGADALTTLAARRRGIAGTPT